MAKSEILLTLRHSRKSFLFEYGGSFLLLFLLAVATLKGFNVPRWAVFSIFSLSFAGIFTAEFSRYFGDRYKITQEKFMIIKGIIKIKKQNVYYQPLGFIPDINFKQTAMQRILGYGTVSISSGNSLFEIRNVDRPNKVLRLIEDLIGRNKHEALKTPEEKAEEEEKEI